MKKGEKTKKHIIEQAAILLNRQGYLATSMADIVKATGIQKGGLYNHFTEKEDLALQAYDYCCQTTLDQVKETVMAEPTAAGRLKAFITAYSGLDVPGGCPIANAAIEADNMSLKLMERARMSMQDLKAWIEEMVNDGVQSGELKADADAGEAAAVILSGIEGALLMNKIFGDAAATIEPLQQHLIRYVDSELSAG